MAILLHLRRPTMENNHSCTPRHWHAVLMTQFKQPIALQAARLSDFRIHAWHRALPAYWLKLRLCSHPCELVRLHAHAEAEAIVAQLPARSSCEQILYSGAALQELVAACSSVPADQAEPPAMSAALHDICMAASRFRLYHCQQQCCYAFISNVQLHELAFSYHGAYSIQRLYLCRSLCQAVASSAQQSTYGSLVPSVSCTHLQYRAQCSYIPHGGLLKRSQHDSHGCPSF